jgi:response regulator RpfG family c-di-GMP phosphodiesterase
MRVTKSMSTAGAVGGIALICGATLAIGASGQIGLWLVAGIGCALLAATATGTALAIAAAARGGVARRPPLDAMTSLPDAEALRVDLSRVLEGTEDRRHLLCVFALDGLKLYNDSYGEPLADALLGWLGRKLRDAVGERGRAYRLRGGSFAVLAAGPTELTAEVRDDAAAALFEVGDGFVIWSAAAEVSLPDDARTVADALELADRRVRTQRDGQPSDAELHPPKEAIETLALSDPDYDAGELARRVGHRIGIPAGSLDDLEAAALLRDVGNVGVPSAVLDRPGALPDYEWRFIRLHTAVGGRLLAARFGMDAAANLVRASHERWDGFGYPDGLAGDAIPLGSRIVFVCGAFVDMTTARPHRAALDPEAALAQLDDGAGSQFDPDVVRVFRDVLETDGDLVVSERRLRARRPLRVLLAESDPVERFLTRRAIEAAGHDCAAVGDGASAWEAHLEAPSDVVLTDELLPEITGIELCRRIRADDGAHPYMVLLATGLERERARLEAGADADEIAVMPLARLDLEVTLSRAGSVLARRQPSGTPE